MKPNCMNFHEKSYKVMIMTDLRRLESVGIGQRLLALAAVALLLVLGLQILPVGSIDEALSGADCEARGTDGGRGESDAACRRIVRHVFADALQETEHCCTPRLRKVLPRAHAQEIEHDLLEVERLGLEGNFVVLATFATAKGRRLLGHGQHGGERHVLLVEILFVVLGNVMGSILLCCNNQKGKQTRSLIVSS